jgi:hypothetical protein
MALSRSAHGVRMGDMRALQDAIGGLQSIDTPTAALTAQSDGTQANAAQLVNGINTVGTVGGSGYSVQLPPAVKGSFVLVANAGANPMQVFGKNGRTDTINGTAGATGVSQTNGLTALYMCAVNGAWSRLLSA